MRVDSTSPRAARRAPTVSDRLLLRFGARGPQVRELQLKLKALGFPVEVDGVFGPRTAAAVRAFQQQRGLQVDGVVGQQTWGAFEGLQLPPGSDMLAGTAPSGPVAVDSSFEGPRPTPNHGAGCPDCAGTSFEGSLGNGQQVQAYINGQPSNITVYSVGNGQFLRSDAAQAFLQMQREAAAAGINLTATSGFRTMAQQQELYRRYLNGTGNLAARPGYSNHQGGISMDIGNIGGYDTAAYRWLQANASRFGFQNDVQGEYWHWTFKG